MGVLWYKPLLFGPTFVQSARLLKVSDAAFLFFGFFLANTPRFTLIHIPPLK